MKRWLVLGCMAVVLALGAGFARPAAALAEEQTSDFINNIQSIREVSSAGSLSSLASSDTDVAIVQVESDSKLRLGSDTAPFVAEEFGKAIPAFYVEDETSAQAAVSLIAEQAPYAFVVSDNAALVRSVRESCTTAGGIIDLREAQLSAPQIRDTVNENLAKSAIVSAGQLDADEVMLLKKLFINVYIEAETEEECVSALACGADGIVNAQEQLLSEAMDLGAEAGIFSPRPFVVSHRGNSQAVRGAGRSYYENTVAAARAAYDAYHPDFIEIDLYLSADGHVVISHDASLDRMTTGTGNIESMTLSQIREFKVDGGLGESAEYLDEIAVLEDYFEEFREDELMFYLEIKSAKTECVDAALEAIGEYGMEWRVNFISFDAAQLAYAQSVAPEISVSYLTNGEEYELSSPTFAEEVLSVVNPLNASLSPTWERMDAEGTAALNRYGVKVNAWTLNMEAAFFREMRTIGYSSYTTDFCGWMEEYPYEISFPEEIVVAPGETFSVDAKLALWSGETEEAEFTGCFLSDGLEETENGFCAAEEGEETIVLLYEGKMFSLLSAPISVSVREGGEETPAGGCAGEAVSALPFASLAVAAALPLLILRRRRG